jgi:hypothetical protein
MFPLPYRNAPNFSTPQNVGGISIFVLNTKSAAHILPRAVLRIGYNDPVIHCSDIMATLFQDS